jgi:hypothetical protein
VAEAPRAPRGLIDTSVVIDLDQIGAGQLPNELAVSAVTMAELAAGPHATGDAGERARRQDRLQRAEAAFDQPSTRCRSMATLPERTDASTQPSSRGGVRHAVPGPSI